MKTLIYTLLTILPLMAFGEEAENNITCALENVKVGSSSVKKGNAREVIVFNKIGGNVYEKINYSAHRYSSLYQAHSTGPGTLHRLIKQADGQMSLGHRLTLTQDLLLKVNRTTGGYPGAGSPPKRIHEFKCLFDYLPIESVTRRQVFEDFK